MSKCYKNDTEYNDSPVFVLASPPTQPCLDLTIECKRLKAAKSRWNQLVEQYLIDTNQRNVSLHKRASLGSIPQLEDIEQNQLMEQNAEGATPLLLAIKNGHVELALQILIKNPAVILTSDNHGVTVFHLSLQNSYYGILILLINMLIRYDRIDCLRRAITIPGRNVAFLLKDLELEPILTNEHWPDTSSRDTNIVLSWTKIHAQKAYNFLISYGQKNVHNDGRFALPYMSDE